LDECSFQENCDRKFYDRFAAERRLRQLLHSARPAKIGGGKAIQLRIERAKSAFM